MFPSTFSNRFVSFSPLRNHRMMAILLLYYVCALSIFIFSFIFISHKYVSKFAYISELAYLVLGSKNFAYSSLHVKLRLLIFASGNNFLPTRFWGTPIIISTDYWYLVLYLSMPISHNPSLSTSTVLYSEYCTE